jgi:hypothetical protein
MRSSLLIATLFSICWASIACSAPVVGGVPPIADGASLKVPQKLPRLAPGDLVVTKAEAQVYPGAAVGLKSPKVQLQVNYCAKNVGYMEVTGPLRAKFYWDGIGPFSASPALPGIEGSLFEVSTAGLTGGTQRCGTIKLNFDSAAALQQSGVLSKNPTVGIWAQGSNEGANASNSLSNNTKKVTVVGAF